MERPIAQPAIRTSGQGRVTLPTVDLSSGRERFTTTDLCALSVHVAATWRSAVDLDWSAQAGTVEWSCTQTADHAVDCVWAPAFFLASRRRDGYPDLGVDMTLGPHAD